MSDVCAPHHDPFNAGLTLALVIASIPAYLPQHYRIISKGTSHGLSPWFLLLGSSGSAAAFFNIVTLQWSIILCCPVLSLSSCLEGIGGIFHLGLIWALFTTTNVLYLIYYPPHLKYVSVSLDSEIGTNANGTESLESVTIGKEMQKSQEWDLSVKLFRVLVSAFILMLLITIYVVSRPRSGPGLPSPNDLSHPWALFLGLTSTLLTVIQYVPQLLYTWRSKLVRALSIPWLCIQISAIPWVILSIARRPGTDFTSYLPFAVSGSMQFTLLCLCVAWTVRQRRLGIDEFGNPLNIDSRGLASGPGDADMDEMNQQNVNEETPLVPKPGGAGRL